MIGTGWRNAMIVYHGVVRGQVVVVSEGAQLDEGSLVEVRLPGRRRSKPARTEAEFKQRLLHSGLLREIKTPVPLAGTEDRRPIYVEGKPLSQTIIEERR
jgi:hypothetical protein